MKYSPEQAPDLPPKEGIEKEPAFGVEEPSLQAIREAYQSSGRLPADTETIDDVPCETWSIKQIIEGGAGPLSERFREIINHPPTLFANPQTQLSFTIETDENNMSGLHFLLNETDRGPEITFYRYKADSEKNKIELESTGQETLEKKTTEPKPAAATDEIKLWQDAEEKSWWEIIAQKLELQNPDFAKHLKQKWNTPDLGKFMEEASKVRPAETGFSVASDGSADFPAIHFFFMTDRLVEKGLMGTGVIPGNEIRKEPKKSFFGIHEHPFEQGTAPFPTVGDLLGPFMKHPRLTQVIFTRDRKNAYLTALVPKLKAETLANEEKLKEGQAYMAQRFQQYAETYFSGETAFHHREIPAKLKEILDEFYEITHYQVPLEQSLQTAA